jgi:hypothetical protein
MMQKPALNPAALPRRLRTGGPSTFLNAQDRATAAVLAIVLVAPTHCIASTAATLDSAGGPLSCALPLSAFWKGKSSGKGKIRE